MCDICMHSPCLSGCPNAPDPTPVTYCRSCGEPIVPGDEYADIDGERGVGDAWMTAALRPDPEAGVGVENGAGGRKRPVRGL